MRATEFIVEYKSTEPESELAKKLLEHEIQMYLYLKKENQKIKIPEIKYIGTFDNYKYIVMELLDKNLKQKYNMKFNVLVLDCEGAIYYILKNEPEILNDIETIIIENDFTDITHKVFVNNVFESYNFKIVYNKSGGFQPLYNCFYEVWKK